MARQHGTQRGFTLVEVGIALAILALAAAVIIPSLGGVSRAELRQAASGVAATVRTAYDDAALSGRTYRLTFTPGKRDIRVQATEQTITFDENNSALSAAMQAESELNALGSPFDAAAGDATKTDKEKDAERDKQAGASPAGVLGGLLSINKLGERSAAAGFSDEGKFTLNRSTRILDIWTDGMEKPATEGEVYLYFFPNGYTQDALVHLEDTEKRVFTVKVSALTGRSEVMDSYVEVPN